MAKRSEITRSESQTPRRIKPSTSLQLHQKPPVRGKHINKAESRAKVNKGLSAVLLSVGNVKVVTNILNVKRSEPKRNMIFTEGSLTQNCSLTQINWLKVRIIHPDDSCFQV